MWFEKVNGLKARITKRTGHEWTGSLWSPGLPT